MASNDPNLIEIIAILVFLAIMAYAGLQMLLYEPILILIILIAIVVGIVCYLSAA